MSDAKQPAKRGRKPRAIAVSAKPVLNPERLDEAGEATQLMQQMAAAYNDHRDLVNQILGQAQAFSAASNLLQTFGVSKLAFVKENKLYQALAGQRTPNGLELKGTWVEFCGLLGVSDEKANQDIANLRAFGEEALESMSRMGIGYRELGQYRRLPDDQRSALIEVAKAGDKEGLLDLAESLIAKHTKASEAKDKEIADLKEKNADKDRVIAQKEAHTAKLIEQMHRREGLTDVELHAELERSLEASTFGVIGALLLVRRDINALRSLDRLPGGLYAACGNALERIVSEALSIGEDCFIPVRLLEDIKAWHNQPEE